MPYYSWESGLILGGVVVIFRITQLAKYYLLCIFFSFFLFFCKYVAVTKSSEKFMDKYIVALKSMNTLAYALYK